MGRKIRIGSVGKNKWRCWLVLGLAVILLFSAVSVASAEEPSGGGDGYQGELEPYTVTTCTYPKKFEGKRKQVLQKIEALKGKRFDQCDACLTSDKKGAKKILQSNNSICLSAYFGKLKNGRPDGFGIVFDGYLLYYAGEWKQGQIDGYGMKFSEDGSVSEEGEFKNGKLDGDGIKYYTSDNEVIHEGLSLIFDKMPLVSLSQIETYVYIDIQVLTPSVEAEGTFKKGVLDGKKAKKYYVNYIEKDEDVTCVNPESNYGILKYEGEMRKGAYSGAGKLYYSNGALKYKGKFKKGKYHGKGILYNPNGSINYKGEFKNGAVK